MGSVEVTPISLPRDTVRFVKTWFPIYENDPHWVPPLFYERKRFFDPGKNPYFKVAEVQCFIASLDGRDVGTISAVIDEVYQAEEAGTGFFGFFEFIDDLAVAAALLDAARRWIAVAVDREISSLDFDDGDLEFGPAHIEMNFEGVAYDVGDLVKLDLLFARISPIRDQ